ncbi:flavodoxin domain-containing protein [Gymnodinialimonas ulvae]|uniref:flavodoxin domain-containing protein n=1 Tax=Gymnodinialimonas ulvae TaxID=3126504 RepID=UPI00309A3A02
MKILILFDTVEGLTGRIARLIADQVRKAGHAAHLVDAAATDLPDLDHADAVILAASVHQRRHPARFEALVAAHKADLADRPTLMLSVSLNAAFPEGRSEAEDYLLEMKMRTGLTPSEEMLVGGAVRTEKYDYFAMMVVRHVVLRGRDVDMSQSEHDFTDYDAVRAKVSAFLEACAAPA